MTHLEDLRCKGLVDSHLSLIWFFAEKKSKTQTAGFANFVALRRSDSKKTYTRFIMSNSLQNGHSKLHTLQEINISHRKGKGKSSSKCHFWGIVSSLEGNSWVFYWNLPNLSQKTTLFSKRLIAAPIWDLPHQLEEKCLAQRACQLENICVYNPQKMEIHVQNYYGEGYKL